MVHLNAIGCGVLGLAALHRGPFWFCTKAPFVPQARFNVDIREGEHVHLRPSVQQRVQVLGVNAWLGGAPVELRYCLTTSGVGAVEEHCTGV